MSREIIELGNVPKYIIRCGYCGTLFTYNRSDVERRRKLGRKVVVCLRCGERIEPTYEVAGDDT